MTTNFDLMKNGKVATSVWANAKTKEIYPANKNPFGYNAVYHLGDDFHNKYGRTMKINQGKSDYRMFYYSAKSMNEAGFTLVLRGQNPIW